MSEKKLEDLFDNTEEVFIILTEISVFYVRYLIVILDFLKNKNIKTSLILIKGLHPVYPNFYSKIYWDRKSSDAERFLISKKEHYDLRVRVIDNIKERKKQYSDQIRHDAVESCNNSIRSYLSTHKLKTEGIEPYLNKKKIKKLWSKQEENYFDILSFLENDPSLKTLIGKIIFLNGRLPNQSAIKYFCTSFGKSFLSLEEGRPPNKRMHLSRNQTAVMSEFAQELASQLKRSNNPIQKQIDFSEEFLQRNMTDRNFNHHLNLAKDEIHYDHSNLDNVKIATIFTSTIGEFIANNGVESYGWGSQYEAIESTVKYLLERNYEVLIRMHPNSARFSWRDIKKILDIEIIYGIRVYPPWAQINSYDLVTKSEFVFTWGSTIGLEASALGKKTYIFSPTYYSLIADVRIFSPRSLVEQDLESWITNRDLAKQAIYISNNHGLLFNDRTLTKGTYLILRDLDVLNASYNPKIRNLMKKSYFFSANNISNFLMKLKFKIKPINSLLNLILKFLKRS